MCKGMKGWGAAAADNNLRTLTWFTQSRFWDELNQEKVVTSHLGITSHSSGMVTESRGLTMIALEARLKEERRRVVVAIILGRILSE